VLAPADFVFSALLSARIRSTSGWKTFFIAQTQMFCTG